MSSTAVQRAVVGSVSALTAGSVLGVAATQPHSIASGLVDLAALIVVGSSTNPTGSGVEDFYGGKFKPADPNDIVVVNFLSGPTGIEDALTGNNDVVLASGWGASNASHVLVTDDSPNVEKALWVLDNNLNIPNGGFATRYPGFSRLVLIDPTPTPTDAGATVIETRYEYDINSDAPGYPLNAVATANSLVAYLDGHEHQSDVVLPVDEQGNVIDQNGNPVPCPSTCTVHTANGPVYIEKVGDVTYVTYPTDGLPLVQPLRALPGGDVLADAIEPALTAVVNYGYPDNNPIGDPNQSQPAGFVPSAPETKQFVANFTAGVRQGIQNAGSDLSSAASSPLTTQSPTTTQPKPQINVAKNSPIFRPGGDFNSAVADAVKHVPGGGKAGGVTQSSKTSGKS